MSRPPRRQAKRARRPADEPPLPTLADVIEEINEEARLLGRDVILNATGDFHPLGPTDGRRALWLSELEAVLIRNSLEYVEEFGGGMDHPGADLAFAELRGRLTRCVIDWIGHPEDPSVQHGRGSSRTKEIDP